MKKTRQTNSSSKKSTILFIAGILLLVTGLMLLTINRDQLGNLYSNDMNTREMSKIIDSLKREPPTFEIGYAIVELNKFKWMQQRGRQHDSDALVFPIFQNSIAKRIETDSPFIIPDYTHIAVEHDMDDFAGYYKKKVVVLREVGVGCLIIKQTGIGNADSVTLSSFDVKLPDAVSIYDGTDLAYLLPENYSNSNSDQSISINSYPLGNMNTGSTILIPLYVTNFFERPEDGEIVSYWQLIMYNAIVPSTINYTHNGKRDSLSLKEVIARPIDIR